MASIYFFFNRTTIHGLTLQVVLPSPCRIIAPHTQCTVSALITDDEARDMSGPNTSKKKHWTSTQTGPLD